MDKIYNKNQKLIMNIIYTSFVFTLAHMIAVVISLDLNILLQILIVFIGSIMVKFFLFNPLILLLLLILSFFTLISVNYFFPYVLPIFIERILYLFSNIFNNFLGNENILPDNLLLFWGIVIVLVSLFTAFILFKDKSIYLLLPVYIFPFLSYWYIFYDEAYWMISIFLVFFFTLMGLKKYIKGNPKVNYSQDYNFDGLYVSWAKTSFIYGVCIVIIAIILPKSNKHIQFSWLHQQIYSVFPGIADLRSYDGYSRDSGRTSLFDFSISSYRDENNSRLGGPLTLSDKKIMTVRTDDSLYLRGNVRHTYSGDSWSTVTFPTEKKQLKKNFSKLSYLEKEKYYNKKHITITNHSFASTTIFSPYIPSNVHFEGNHILEISRDGILSLANGIYSGESYTVEVEIPLPYGILKSLGEYKLKNNIEDLDIYLQIPENKITDRTKDLVKEIVKDANNDFEKSVAIENYLRNNYEYTLDVEELPEGKEFIDYFLFEEQKGYCTYYATAMAMMLRLEGIPTRYIEGYLVQNLVEPGIYEVSHKDAHAWVEAFIEPTGWTSFEPTSIYPITSRLEDYEANEEVSFKDPEVPRENNRIRENNEVREEIEEEGRITPEQNIEDNNGIRANLEKNNADIFILILSTVIIGRITLGISTYFYRGFKAKKLPNNKKIIYLYERILNIIESLGYPQEYGETHYEYADRIAYKFYSHDHIGIKEITDIFVRSKYSHYLPTDEDVLTLIHHKKILDKRLKKYSGSILYYYHKYIKIK